MRARTSKPAAYRPPLLVSFSGLDGAGKSTQIANLQQFIQGRGLRSTLLAFWDNVVVLSRYREGFVHKVYGSERGVGAPGQPVNRQDKNVRRWYLTVMRHVLYLLDAVHLTVVVGRARKSGAAVIILDRYIYDELANLPLANFATRFFVHLVTAFAPRPDVAYLLDVDPAEAVRRKPEYPIGFLYLSRRSYHQLARMVGRMTVIPPLSLADAMREVESAFAIAVNDRWQVVTSELDRAHAA